jgi:hypothetical protein
MKIALGYDVSAEPAPAAASSESSPASAEVIEPEVIDPSNPWSGKN